MPNGRIHAISILLCTLGTKVAQKLNSQLQSHAQERIQQQRIRAPVLGRVEVFAIFV